MPDWLAEPSRSLYLLLAIGVIICVAAYAKTRRRIWLIAVGIFALILGCLVLCDCLYQSDREQIASSLKIMAESASPNQLDAVFAHISDRFDYNRIGKREFRAVSEMQTRRWSVRGLTVWNFEVVNIDHTQRRAEVRFQFKIQSDRSELTTAFYWCKAIFIRDPDGQWRLQTFTVYPPSGMDQPLAIPGVG